MLETVCKAKVCDDDIPVAIKEKVLELEITVDDFLLVDVPDTRDELGKELCGVFFLEVAMGKNVVEELASGGILENNADVFVCLYDIVESDDVWVLKCLMATWRGKR